MNTITIKIDEDKANKILGYMLMVISIVIVIDYVINTN